MSAAVTFQEGVQPVNQCFCLSSSVENRAVPAVRRTTAFVTLRRTPGSPASIANRSAGPQRRWHAAFRTASRWRTGIWAAIRPKRTPTHRGEHPPFFEPFHGEGAEKTLRFCWLRASAEFERRTQKGLPGHSLTFSRRLERGNCRTGRPSLRPLLAELVRPPTEIIEKRINSHILKRVVLEKRVQ